MIGPIVVIFILIAALIAEGYWVRDILTSLRGREHRWVIFLTALVCLGLMGVQAFVVVRALL